MSSDRDRILEQALKHELGAAGTPPAGAPALRSFSEGGCLDAETLGAWTDGALAPAAMAAAEAHVASCERCLALVGTMARSAPVTSGAPGTLGTEGTRGTFSLWRWWLAPIAAGVTAVTLWMVVPEPPPLEQSREAKAAQAPAAETITPAAPDKDKAFAEPPADQFAQRDRLDAVARDERQQNKLKEERNEESRLRQTQEQVTLADAAAPAAPPAAAPMPAPTPPPATVALQAPQARAESVPVPPRENAAGVAGGALQKSARAANAIEIATLDPSLGWRIVGDRIERSDDGGKTWRLTRQNAGDGIVAGSAPSNSVCWFVGRAGRVLLTIDSGATFRDVSLAEPLDLTGVAARDAANAMLFSANGRSFRTDDGGRTWRLY